MLPGLVRIGIMYLWSTCSGGLRGYLLPGVSHTDSHEPHLKELKFFFSVQVAENHIFIFQLDLKAWWHWCRVFWLIYFQPSHLLSPLLGEFVSVSGGLTLFLCSSTSNIPGFDPLSPSLKVWNLLSQSHLYNHFPLLNHTTVKSRGAACASTLVGGQIKHVKPKGKHFWLHRWSERLTQKLSVLVWLIIWWGKEKH